MFNLKIVAGAGAILFAFAIGSTSASATTIKNGTSPTYSCTVHKNGYEVCKYKKKKKTKRDKDTQKDIGVIDLNTQVTKMKQAEWPQPYEASNAKIVKEAERLIGLHERKDRNALQKMFNIDPAKTPWCAAFVNTVLEKTGLKGTGSLQANSFVSYGKRTNEPKQGDIVVMHSHVGFFDGYEYVNGVKYVRVLGGNQSHMVTRTYYLASRVVSYRRAA
jgi:uncharacterized protein (TIGR02594 family)